MRLQVAPDGTFGPFAARSHHVVEVDDLPLATERVAEATPFGQRFAGAESIDVVATTGGSAHVLVNDAPVKRGRRTIRPRHRPMTVREHVGDREFALDARGFWQVHRLAAATLTEAVQSAVDEALFDPRAANLDLYGGVGLLAAALGDRFGSTVRITSVEGDETATDHAAENLAEWIGASAVTERVERFVTALAADASPAERSRLRAATVILDPPRSGAGRAVVDAIAELSPGTGRVRRLRPGRPRARPRDLRRRTATSSAPCARSTCSRTRTTSKRWRCWPGDRAIPGGPALPHYDEHHGEGGNRR